MTQTLIETENQYRAVLRALTERGRPPRMLRMLMNMLESYRQARKMGWSRPQNKLGVTTFHSFELDLQQDAFLLRLALDVVDAEFPTLARDDRSWLEQFVRDDALRAFVFVHDVEDGEGTFEGATVSLGRKAAGSPKHRDRFDLIVESAVVEGHRQAPARVRGYVDPYRSPIADHPARCHRSTLPGAAAVSLLSALAAYYARYRDAPEKAWRHWTQDYIAYFGPRTRPIMGTLFPTPVDEAHAAVVLAQRRARSPVQAVP